MIHTFFIPSENTRSNLQTECAIGEEVLAYMEKSAREMRHGILTEIFNTKNK